MKKGDILLFMNNRDRPFFQPPDTAARSPLAHSRRHGSGYGASEGDLRPTEEGSAPRTCLPNLKPARRPRAAASFPSRILPFSPLLTSSLILACALFCPAAAAAGPKPEEPVKVTVDESGELEMWEENGEKIALGVGGVTMTRGEVTLEADRIVIWSGKVSHCYAEGNVVLRQPGSEMRGDALIYDLDARRGKIVSPRVIVGGKGLKWYMGGPEVRQESAGVIKGLDAWISTCGFEKPHWRFRAREITFYVDEKVEARDLVLYFGNVPVFYLPYFFRDLKHDWPWTRYKIGKDSEYGFYAFARVGYDVNDRVKLIVGAEYREDWGWGWPLVLDYHAKGEYFGLVDLYYIDEWDNEPGRPYAGEKRYRAKFYHRHRFGDHLTIDAEYERYSDDTFMLDYFEKELRTNKEPETYLYARSVWEHSSLTGLAKARSMDFVTRTEYLPEAEYRLMSKPLFGNRAYLSCEVRAGNLRREYSENMSLSDPRSGRMDAQTELHVPVKLFRFLELDPFVGARQTWYEKSQNDEDESFWRGAAVCGAALSTTIWRTFDVKNKFLGIDGLRHVLIPEVRFTTITNPRSSDPPFVFDEVDELDELEIVNLSLTNRLQSSRGPARDFLYLKVEADYFPRDSHAARQGMEENWGDVEGTLSILPHPRLSLYQSITYDSDEKDILKGTAAIIFNPAARAGVFQPDFEGKSTVTASSFEARGANPTPGGWSLAYSNSFARDSYSTNTFTVGGPLSDRWSLFASVQYKGMQDEQGDLSVTFRRRLHKWTVDITFARDDDEDVETFWLSFYPEGFDRSLFGFRQTVRELDRRD
jgi:hypothetical protein